MEEQDEKVFDMFTTEDDFGLSASLINCSSINLNSTAEPSPKKSARLAEKRKLREEAGPNSDRDDDFYYTSPYKSARLSSPIKHLEHLEVENYPKTVSPLSTTTTTDAKDSEIDLAMQFQPVNDCFDAIDIGFDDIDIDELSSISPHKFLTDRQKSILFKTELFNEEELQQDVEEHVLETINNDQQSSRDNLRARMEKSEKRRILAQQKKEFDKKRTLDRLLRRPTAKPQSNVNNNINNKFKSRSSQRFKDNEPILTYIISQESNTISFPVGMGIEVFGDVVGSSSSKISTRSQGPILCSVEGCTQVKNYTCSKTKMPVCSLQCYKRNLANYQ